MNKTHPHAPRASKPQPSTRPRAALPRDLPHHHVHAPCTHPLPTLLAHFRGTAHRAPLHSPPAPGHTPHRRTICHGSRTSHSGTHVAIARFYGKCSDTCTIESRRHDSRHAAESDRKSIPSPNRMRAIHGHTLHSPKPARQVESARQPNATSRYDMLLAHRRASAPAPEVTAFLKGREPATSKQA